MILPPGALVAGRYRVSGPPLGVGRSGASLPATDEATGEALVLKFPWDSREVAPEQSARLARRAGLAVSLSHPRWARTRGLVAHEGRWVLVTERVSGGSLVDVSAPLGALAAAMVAEQVAEALVVAHAAGLVHGDLRAESVLLGGEGARVCDPAVLGADQAPELLRPESHAPEVLLGGPATPAADLYGLGVVLSRALLGPEGRAAEPVPAALAALMDQLLQPAPDARPASAQAVRRALRAIVEGRARVPVGELAPVRFRRGWAVHGVDPATGAPAWMARDLTRAEAQALTRRLASAGWQVEASRVALGGRDLALSLALALPSLAVMGGLGAPLLVWATLAWRSRRCRPRLTLALPQARAALPEPRRTPADWSLAAFGLALLGTALGLALWWPIGGVGAALALALAPPLSRGQRAEGALQAPPRWAARTEP